MIKTNQDKSSTYYTHGFHPYPAKFTPQLVYKYLSLYCKTGYKILDPFCGSGTTLVEGVINGINSTGIDLNPIAFIVSRAKTNKYSKNDLLEIAERYKSLLNIFGSGLFDNYEQLVSNVLVPEMPNREHWFQNNILKELAYIKSYVENIKEEKVKDLFLCAFSKIIVKVSNQDSEVRYTAKQKNHPNFYAFNLFIRTINEYITILENTNNYSQAKAEVVLGNTYDVLASMNNDTFDFIITSPPYINTFDYYLYHKLRMFWLGYDHHNVRKMEIGNHHRIDSKTFDIAKSEYILSMTSIINELSRVSKNNSYFVMVIGDGIVDGITIDMSEVIKDICENSHYEIYSIENISLSKITKSFNKKFSNAEKKEHYITLKNIK